MIALYKYTPKGKLSKTATIDTRTITIVGVQRVATEPNPSDKVALSVGNPGFPTHYMLVDRKMVQAMFDALNKGK